jgi:divalent metal cation (Fe/Co/Zn/Cd) transporter
MPMLDSVAGAAIVLMIMRMGYVSVRGAFKQLSAGAPGKTAAPHATE